MRQLSLTNPRRTEREKEHYLMEEQQIQDFVHRVFSDESLRKELAKDPDGVIESANVSPIVERVLRRIVPQLAFGQELPPAFTWW